MTPAGRLQSYIRRRVKETGGVYRKVQWTSRKGCPDCYCWWQGGVYAWIEVKVGKDTFSTLQAREGARMHDAGLRVFVATDERDVERLLLQLGVAPAISAGATEEN